MAGTLTVQNIEGPSSGANANKVIIPSGQTIDVSTGTLVPSAGAVVQQVEYFNDTSFNTSSTSYVSTLASVVITPKYSNSKMFIQVYGGTYSDSYQGIRGSIRKNNAAFSYSAAEDLINYQHDGNYPRGHPVAVATIDNNVGTTNAVTYAYYIKSQDGIAAYFYRNFGIVVQEIKQ